MKLTINLDERQAKIRLKIIERGFFTAVCLFLANGFLNLWNIRWAPVPDQHFILGVFLCALLHAELILRDLKPIGEKTALGGIFIWWGVSGVGVAATSVVGFAKGKGFFADGGLTSVGASVIVALLLFSSFGLTAFQMLRDRRRERNEPEAAE